MHEIIAAKLPEIDDLCRTLGVRRLDVFGSAVDMLVEFDVRPGFDYFGSYFALKEGLERIFNRPVDLLSGASIRNPYFRQNVMDTKEQLYAA
ncbi:MAG TPA: hypothetical protein VH352_09405 [Pseudonocardiaceae bacterium]|nr:hypothetical protein [Pseudonocardiaceae bacterium]